MSHFRSSLTVPHSKYPFQALLKRILLFITCTTGFKASTVKQGSDFVPEFFGSGIFCADE